MPATQVALDSAVRSQFVRKLFPIYSLFTERFGMPSPPVSDVRTLKANSDPALIEGVEKWMDDLDNRIDAFQMRSVVQSTNVGASELRILALLERLLSKPEANTADRSKIDFLLAQLLATRLSLNSEKTPTMAEVAEVLEPAVGKANLVNQMPALESLTEQLLSCHRLSEIKKKTIIERGREAKNALGKEALLPENLVACSRFNFLLRKRCFELMKEEVKLTRSGLKALSEAGIKTLDCSAAKLSGAETVSGLMEICNVWLERKPDDYAHDNPFSQVLALQEIVAKASKENPEKPIQDHASVVATQADDRQKPTPDVIQIYAELATLRREHHQLEERVHQQETALVQLQRASESLREQLAESEKQLQIMQEELDAAEVANSKLREAASPAKQEAKELPVQAPADHEPEEFSVQPPEVHKAEDFQVQPPPQPEPMTALDPTQPVASAEESVAPPKATTMQDVVQSLAQRLEQIREALVAAKASLRKDSPCNMKLHHVSIMLTASETRAFLNPASAADDLICRGVAARFLLLESGRDPGKAGSELVIGVCEAGAQQLQEQAAHLPPDQAERVQETSRLLLKTLKGIGHK